MNMKTNNILNTNIINEKIIDVKSNINKFIYNNNKK